jgi:4-hydroxybenzoate polyprenyltransferase
VVVFTTISALGFIGSTLLFLPRNWIPLAASVPVLVFLLGYSYAKRFTVLAHFWLGAALMLAPVAAWVAIRPVFDAAPLILGAAVMLWVAGFDIIYACQDYAFDRRVGLYSVPARLGVGPALRVAAGCHAAMLVLLALLPTVFPEFGQLYYIGVCAIALLLAYEHWLVRPDDLRRVNLAFFYINAVVSVGLLVVGLLDLLL